MAFRLGDRVLQPVQDFDLPAYDELLVNYLLVPQERVGEFADLMERRPVPAPAAVLA